MKKVVVAMSGGVDSSVAAALLKEQGYEVIGVFMQFWFPKGAVYGENRCCSLESYTEALAVADSLGIKLHKLNFGKQFKDKIVDNFLKEYLTGKTPNPCVACNRFIKFDLLLKSVQTVFDADYLATGHYVRIRKVGKDYQLLRGKDANKDQSYFLYNLDQKKLKHLLFPVGNFTKSEIRKKAKDLKLNVHDRKDSQEVCFVGSSHNEFLKKYLKLKSGNIIDSSNKILGSHQGLPLYTLGQRTGIGLSGGPWYVVGLDYKKNNLIVARNQKKAGLFKTELKCKNVNWIIKSEFPLSCLAQVRYRSKASQSRVDLLTNRQYSVTFKTAQRAIMPGQSVVFYDQEIVLGGGIIV